MNHPRIVIIGGGPAGMSAAIAIAKQGLNCTIVDEGFALGGQIYRKPTNPERAPTPHPIGEQLRTEIAKLTQHIEVRNGHSAWGIFDELRVAVTSPDEHTELLQPQALILAPGAHELVPPFPGWTLPGVMTPGAAQSLIKTMGVAPGKRVMVAGTGPFLLAVACQLIDAGVHVVSVLEASPRPAWLRLPLHGFRTPKILVEGFLYLNKLHQSRVPVRYGRIVVSALGESALNEVQHAPVNAEWFPDNNCIETERVDTLLVGYGFVPRNQLAQMAECKLEFCPEVGGWIPIRDRNLATSVAGIFAAGDGAGVAGSLAAAHEGKLAGMSAAFFLRAIDESTFTAARDLIEQKLSRLMPLRRALDKISTLQPGLMSLVRDDTLVCRCEEVTWGEAREAVCAGSTTYRSLKINSRAGMGACQGRFCWPFLSRLVAAEEKCSVMDIGPPSVRSPLVPITLGSLASESLKN